MKLPNLNKCFVILAILLIIDCSLGGYIGFWREGFWQAVANRDFKRFWIDTGIFSLVALTSCYIYGYSQYVSSYAALIMRRRLTRKALNSNYKDHDGGSQRVQEDCALYPLILISLVGGMLRSVIMIGVFSFILVSQLNFFYLCIPIIYSLLGTLGAGVLAKPLINLNYINQNLEAHFRQVLTKIAYAKAHRNNYNLFIATKRLSYFQTFYNQITIIIPYLILFSSYYIMKISFGVFMQCASSMNEVITNMSYIINSFNDINKFLSCRRRLKEIQVL